MSTVHQPPPTLRYPPDDVPILEWFADAYEAVYVVFHPFVRMPRPLDRYPSRAEVIRSGTRMQWKDVARETGLTCPDQVNTGLLSAIGALRDQFRDPDAADRLSSYLVRTGTTWFPAEGLLPPLLWRDFLSVFETAQEAQVRVVDEAGNTAEMERATLIGNELLLEPLIRHMTGGSLYPASQRFLFTVHWDSFFTLFCGPRDLLQQAIEEHDLEGFFCNRTTEHSWSLPGRGGPSMADLRPS